MDVKNVAWFANIQLGVSVTKMAGCAKTWLGVKINGLVCKNMTGVKKYG